MNSAVCQMENRPRRTTVRDASREIMLKIQSNVGAAAVGQFLKRIPEAQRKEVRNALGTEVVEDENAPGGEKEASQIDTDKANGSDQPKAV